jgi:hypothetical protein
MSVKQMQKIHVKILMLKRIEVINNAGMIGVQFGLISRTPIVRFCPPQPFVTRQSIRVMTFS